MAIKINKVSNAFSEVNPPLKDGIETVEPMWSDRGEAMFRLRTGVLEYTSHEIKRMHIPSTSRVTLYHTNGGTTSIAFVHTEQRYMMVISPSYPYDDPVCIPILPTTCVLIVNALSGLLNGERCRSRKDKRRLCVVM